MERVIEENVVKALKYASETVIPFEDCLSGQTYIDATYHFAKLIDPNYKTWNKKDGKYIVNQITEKRLIRFYELIKDRSQDQITNLVFWGIVGA